MFGDKRKYGGIPIEFLKSYEKMGITPKNIEGFKAQMAEAEKRRLFAMDPNKSKSMTQREREEALNAPNFLLRSVGGFTYEG